MTDMTLEQAWDLLKTDPSAVLIDVRTEAEWNFVGVPDLSPINKSVYLVEWAAGGIPNPLFVNQAGEAAPDKDAPVLLLCRSGARSAAAMNALADAGWKNPINVVAGFEGDLDEARHRVGGWKFNLPWIQG